MEKLQYKMLPIEEKLVWLNGELREKELKQVASVIGMSASSLTKDICIAGYRFDRTARQYVVVQEKKEDATDEMLAYIMQHFNAIQALIEEGRNRQNLCLEIDNRLYAAPTEAYQTRSFKIHQEIYNEFVQLYEEQFRHLKMQHVVSLAIAEFVKSYK
ncbi:hypothetical protein [Lysinibacillus sp. NPDC096212]|uniref:hypothetical protein n=1 Tax=Lysinibacillus sp. NPDC096212 TaxID=3364135 RepID=UPI0038224166